MSSKRRQQCAPLLHSEARPLASLAKVRETSLLERRHSFQGGRNEAGASASFPRGQPKLKTTWQLAARRNAQGRIQQVGSLVRELSARLCERKLPSVVRTSNIVQQHGDSRRGRRQQREGREGLSFSQVARAICRWSINTFESGLKTRGIETQRLCLCGDATADGRMLRRVATFFI